MKKIIIFIMMCILFVSSYAKTNESEEYIKAKVISIEKNYIIDKEKLEEQVESVDLYTVKLLEGIENNKEIKIEFPIYKAKQYNLEIKVGDKVIIYKTFDVRDNDTVVNYYISDVDKSFTIYFLFAFFIVLVLLVSKLNGLKAILALFASIFFILYLFIPAISAGVSPILFSVVSCIFASLVSVYSITGFSKKSLVSILGTVLGVALAGFLSYILTNKMRLTGYTDPELLSYGDLFVNIDLRELISAGVIIGSLGAILDVTISISSSINELYKINNNISFKELYNSSMKIGNDIIGTMINTLILAYIGSSLMSIVLIYIQRMNLSFIRIINYEEISVEILRSICGSIGIIVAVPITSFIGSYIYSKTNKLKH